MYNIDTNLGTVVISDETDAVNALWLFGKYEGIEIDDQAVIKMLNKTGRFRSGTLEIVKTGE